MEETRRLMKELVTEVNKRASEQFDDFKDYIKFYENDESIHFDIIDLFAHIVIICNLLLWDDDREKACFNLSTVEAIVNSITEKEGF